MDLSLNFHHLRYFWVTAREGSVTRAAKKLRVTQPTVSEQLAALEETLGERLFKREGRTLVVTDVGRTVMRFADEIFALGTDLVDTVRGRPTGRPSRLAVGISESVPKVVAYRILEPAIDFGGPAERAGNRIVCYEDAQDRLVAQLAAHALDVVITDEPVSATYTQAYSHLLGECGVGVFGVTELARAARAEYPRSLHQVPMLLPASGTVLRREIDQWLDMRKIVPRVVGEFQDPALMTVFAQAGAGLVVAPDAIARETVLAQGLRRVGSMKPLRQRFYVVTVERRLVHPDVQRIAGAAQKTLFKKDVALPLSVREPRVR
ncbi:MAG TPA: LysR family transcriptional regulator [Labilithrix sp.]|nr:LysR family transcriptional regulator [Labilithrix sp.]